MRGQAIYVFSGSHAHKRTNAAFLLSAWFLLYGGRTPEQVRRIVVCWLYLERPAPCAILFDGSDFNGNTIDNSIFFSLSTYNRSWLVLFLAAIFVGHPTS